MFKMEGAGAKFFGIRPVKTNGIFSYIIFLVPIIFTPSFVEHGKGVHVIVCL